MIKKKTILVSVSFFILFAGFFYVFASSDIWDYDFWWHLSTGRYIVETGKVPDTDPFTYTESLTENKNLFADRKNLILKQYWLAQVIFYQLYSYAGPKSIILLRSFLLISIFFLIYFRFSELKVNPYISFVYLFLLYVQILRSTGDRPVLFTILFTVVIFILLERFVEKRGKSIFLAMPVMLFWANLHGGFIIGNIIIVVFMLGEGVKIILKKSKFSGREIAIFYAATFLALGCSYLNPAGWNAFSIALSPEYKFMEAGIHEYQSLLSQYTERTSSLNYGALVFMVLFPVVLLIRNKRLDITRVLLMTGLYIMAAKTVRYGVYYACIGTLFLGEETNVIIDGIFRKKLSEVAYEKMTSLFTILIFLSSLFFFVGIFRFEALGFNIAKGYSVPVKAVDFVENNKIPGILFNDGGYGGYLAWRLYPWKKTFTDTRWLNYTVQSESGWVLTVKDSIQKKGLPAGKRPLWRRLLDHYNVNIIFMPFFDVYGNVYPIDLQLADDKEWVPVYCDLISLVFVRNKEENREIIEKFRVPKERIYDTLILQGTRFAINQSFSPYYMISLGQIFYKMGRLEDSLTAYKYALRRAPRNVNTQEMINKIESELKQKKDAGKSDGKSLK